MGITLNFIESNFIEYEQMLGMKKLFEAKLQRVWYGHGFSFWYLVLWPLSQLFRMSVVIRHWAYRCGKLKVWHASVPVIVVGNISVGGTGKTPLTLWLVEFLRSHGFHPGVISRGYGGSANMPQAVSVGGEANVVGDEPLLLARRAGCPVWIGRRRSAAAEGLLAAHNECDVLICDDGLQHYALARDIEIAVEDGWRRHGNGQLLPAGPLRELPSRLNTVNAVVAHGGDAARGEFSMRLVGRTFRNLLDNSMTIEASGFSGQLVHAIAGIGNPQGFFNALHDLAIICKTHAFPDHFAFKPEDLQFKEAQAVLMTEKDAVRCLRFAQPNWWYLEVSADVDCALGKQVVRKLKEIR
jgi:tetraacyldisaccharide 4'-kinase